MFLGQGILWQQVWSCLNSVQDASNNSDYPAQARPNPGEALKECTSRLKSTLSSLSIDVELPDAQPKVSAKRQRTSSTVEEERPFQKPRIQDKRDQENDLPPDDLIDALVEIYFSNIHPWIPILHAKQFRERMSIPVQRHKLRTIFHAIVSLCVRFSKDERLDDAEVRAQYSKRSRDIVILQSMESFSVENLQALIICAFDTVSSFELGRLWYYLTPTDWQWSGTVSVVHCWKYDQNSRTTTA